MDLPAPKKHKSSRDAEVSGPGVTLPDVVNFQNPNNIAVEHYESSENTLRVTYSELHDAKIRVVDFLKVVEGNNSIGISADVPTLCVPALMIGINSSSNAFVCLPPAPDSATLISQLKITHLFSNDHAEPTKSIGVLNIHNNRLLLLKISKSTQAEDRKTGKHPFAYAVATSGSTGVPAVVRVTHSSTIPNILDLRCTLSLTSEDKVAQLTPLTFDPSIIEIFAALSCGGTLVTTSKNLRDDPHQLLASIVSSRVTIIQSTPSLLMHRWSLNTLKSTIFGEESSLRVLLLGGELFPNPKMLFDIKHPNNNTRVFNIYGITEVSCWASIAEIYPDSDPNDLGRLLDETLFKVEDEDNETVSEGEGQLLIGSTTRICLLNSEKMEDVETPVFRSTGDLVIINNGRILFKGRKNRRVKRFGQRLNLQNLEDHVNQLEFVKNCCALFLPQNQSLHVFFTTENQVDDKNLRQNFQADVLKHLKQLSSIYQPDSVKLLEQFPLTTNGKICVRSLKKLYMTTEKFTNLNVGEIFQKMWSNYLTKEHCGFVDAGGTSITALQIANELAEKTGNEYPELIGRMLRNETFESCKNYICQDESSQLPEVLSLTQPFVHTNSSKPSENHKNTHVIFEGENSCPWQKCRGRTFKHKLNDDPNCLKYPVPLGESTKIHVKNSYDLLKCIDASPTVFCCDNKIYATVGSHAGVICTLELRNDEAAGEIWKIQLPDRIEASILVNNNFRGIVGCYDGFVYCVDLRFGEIVWKFETGDAVKCTAAFSSQRENIFFGSYDRRVYCISVKSGAEIWSLKPSDGSISATPLVHQGTNSVLFCTLDGKCASVDQNRGIILWRCEFNFPIFSAPVLSKNKSVIVCDVSGICRAFDIATGKEVWSVNIKGNVFSHLILHKDPAKNTEYLIVASKNKKLYKFLLTDQDSPKLNYKVEVASAIIATPWVDSGITIIASTSGKLVIVNLENGDVIGKYQLPGEVYSSPVVHRNFIVVGCRDNNFYVLLWK